MNITHLARPPPDWRFFISKKLKGEIMRTKVRNDKTDKKMTKSQTANTTITKISKIEMHTNQQSEEEQPQYWWQKGQYA